MDKEPIFDCIIIGGGPAGLTAALYLARYRRKVLLYDTYKSRANTIPRSHNYPGFPQGISGKGLLSRLRKQLVPYKISCIEEQVECLEKIDNKFVITTKTAKKAAKFVILATGVQDIEPLLANLQDGVQRGLVRHCPVCDAYEVIDKKIVVIGSGKCGLDTALFLRDYSQHISLLTLGECHWNKAAQKQIQAAKIAIVSYPIKTIHLSKHQGKIKFINKTILQFDCIYSALGCVKNNDIIKGLNLKLKKGLIIVDEQQETSEKGLFAAGDIVSALHQICVATSQAAIAATSIHKQMRAKKYQ